MKEEAVIFNCWPMTAIEIPVFPIVEVAIIIDIDIIVNVNVDTAIDIVGWEENSDQR